MPDAAALRIGGLTPFSATDYPDHLAAVIFCQGCAWRCAYCHNPHLLPRRGGKLTSWTEVLAFLQRRRGILDAVVFSGGEPTLQPALPAAMREIRRLGFRVGLHTAGLSPRLLKRALPAAHWVGMDIKAPFDDYDRITGVAGSGICARESAQAVIDSGVDCEFRTTLHSAQLQPEAVDRLTRALGQMGARRYALQEFRSDGCASQLPAHPPRSACFSRDFREHLATRFEHFEVRER